MTINPELETATLMSSLIKLPSAIEIDTFAKGKVELLKFQVPENSVLDHIKVMNLSTKLHCNVLVCIVERGDQVFIPSGNFEILSNDYISIVASPSNAIDFFQKVGVSVNNIRKAMLIGGSTITVYLAKCLLIQI